MYSNQKDNALGDTIPGPPPPPLTPDTGFGMVWPGNNQMMQMQPMMVPVIHQMVPGQMHSHFNQQIMQQHMVPPPPPVTPDTRTNSTHMERAPQNTQTYVMPKVYPAPPVPETETSMEETYTNEIDMDVTGDSPAAPPLPEVKDKEKQRTRSPNSDNRRDQARDRRLRDSKDYGRRECEGRRDDKRRSHSRERPHRERERRSKWHSGGKDLNTSNSSRKGLLPTPGAIGFSDPSNIEMMGQAQLEMMKSQQMGVVSGPQMGVVQGQGMITSMNPGIMMMDPTIMAQMFPQMVQQSIMLSVGVLEPPYSAIQHPQRRSRPSGCHTVFVGGLQESVCEDTIKEIFERFGKITTIRLKKGFCHVRFDQEASVEFSFCLTGYRLILNDSPNDVITSGLLIDYALNRDDQYDFERKRSNTREVVPARFEHISQISHVADKIKNEDKFADALPTLIAWLESGECSKKNANTFYSMIQATNNHTRRLMNEKLVFDDEIQEMKDKMKDKALKIVTQFEQVVKVLTAANHRRVWDHFNKMQRKNVEMWFKMSEELKSVKEEFQQFFYDDDMDATAKKGKYEDMYNEVKTENENLVFELEAYKNEVHVAKSEAAREFEKFKAHFIAEQALLNAKTGNKMPTVRVAPLQPQPPTPQIFGVEGSKMLGAPVGPGEARLISVVSMFLLVHPLGVSLEYVLSYVRTLCPDTNESTLQRVLQKHGDVFTRSTSGVGAQMEHKWSYIPLKMAIQ